MKLVYFVLQQDETASRFLRFAIHWDLHCIYFTPERAGFQTKLSIWLFFVLFCIFSLLLHLLFGQKATEKRAESENTLNKLCPSSHLFLPALDSWTYWAETFCQKSCSLTLEYICSWSGNADRTGRKLTAYSGIAGTCISLDFSTTIVQTCSVVSDYCVA